MIDELKDLITEEELQLLFPNEIQREIFLKFICRIIDATIYGGLC